MTITYSGIILSAGTSSRMGKTKALLPYNDTTLLNYQISQFNQSLLNETIVVLGHDATSILHSLTTLPSKIMMNSHFHNGKSSSIKVGVKNSSTSAQMILIANVDQPVSTRIINKMCAEFIKKRPKIIIPTYKQKRGHPVLFCSSLRSDLLSVSEQTQGLREIIHRYSSSIQEIELDEPSILHNFNTPNDLSKLLETIRRRIEC
ncbi:nucleotidyltransferase family protein [Bacillus timonensis]|nr:nucleotidyltransferase family protein [Bacillus timonensis]